jgi:hypothetical protein
MCNCRLHTHIPAIALTVSLHSHSAPLGILDGDSEIGGDFGVLDIHEAILVTIRVNVNVEIARFHRRTL